MTVFNLTRLFPTRILIGAFFGAIGPLAQMADAEPRAGEQLENSGEGIVVASHAWDVVPAINSQIEKLHFSEGQMVEKGDLLVEFFDAFAILELDLAEANLAQGEVKLRQAKDDLDRMTELNKRQAVSEAQFRDFGFAFASAEADVRRLQIEVEKAATIVRLKKIVSPLSGQISAPRYNENANVDIVDGTEIATVRKLDPVFVELRLDLSKALERLKEIDSLEDFRKRMRLELVLPGGEVFPHMGKIATSAYVFDKDTQTSKVLIEFANPDLILRPGMKVFVNAYLGPKVD